MNVNINNTLKSKLLQRGFTSEFADLTLQYAELYFANDSSGELDNPTHSPEAVEDLFLPQHG